MITQTIDPKFINKAVADLMVDLHDGFTAEKWLSNPANIALTDGKNIMLVERKGIGFEIHWLFRDRGKQAVSVGNAMLSFAFDQLGAKVIKGLTPVQCKAARWFSRQMGGISYGIINTVHGPMELFVKVKP